MKPDQRTLPVARRDDLLIEELPEEVVVYDLRTHQVHCLNSAAARAWEFCDGEHTRAELAEMLQREFDLPPDDAIVDLTLTSLVRSALLPAETSEIGRNGVSRRAVVRRLALVAGVAALLPSVKSVQAAPAGFIASCRPDYHCVAPGTDCSPCYVPRPAPPGALAKQCEDFRCWHGACLRLGSTGC